MSEIIKVLGNKINTIKVGSEDYISLTDIAKGKGDKSDQIIQNWMKNRNTIEFLGLWEEINNKNFKPLQLEGFKKDIGLNSFLMSPKKWIEGINAKGIVSKSGRYNGGTFAHKDIAFEFASWISAEFKLYLITEFQRLKEFEQKRLDPEWNVSRILSKVNYKIHTDSIKDNLIEGKIEDKIKQGFKYSSEADMLNLAVFGKTNKQWRSESGITSKKKNIREYASINELIVLSNSEYLNSLLIEQGISESDRFKMLIEKAQKQLQNFINNSSVKKLTNLGTKEIRQINNK